MRYCDCELEARLNDLESERIERKETSNGRAHIEGRQVVCAFANDLPVRAAGSDTVTVTKNEIMFSLNKSEDSILALVELLPYGRHEGQYVRRPFQREPDFRAASVNYHFRELLDLAEVPV